jgi:hypothetical protein
MKTEDHDLLHDFACLPSRAHHHVLNSQFFQQAIRDVCLNLLPIKKREEPVKYPGYSVLEIVDCRVNHIGEFGVRCEGLVFMV